MKKHKHIFLKVLVFMALKILEIGAALILFVFISLLGKLFYSLPLSEKLFVPSVTSIIGYFLIGIAFLVLTALILLLVWGLGEIIIPFIKWNWKQAKEFIEDWRDI